jgi:hypothetical protein
MIRRRVPQAERILHDDLPARLRAVVTPGPAPCESGRAREPANFHDSSHAGLHVAPLSGRLDQPDRNDRDEVDHRFCHGEPDPPNIGSGS